MKHRASLTSPNAPTPVSTRHRVAIIGVGLMGRRHARIMSELPERFRVVGVVDRDAGRAEIAARTWGVPVLSGEAEAIAHADLVVIATPIATHATLAIEALAAGRDVLVEKPVCASASEARAVLAVAARERRQLFVGHSERFNPVVRALARLLRGDDVVAIELHRIGAGRVPLADEPGVLVNLGVHDFDLASYLTSAKVEVKDAVGRSGDGHATPEDLAHVLLATEHGSIGHVYVDRTARVRHRTVRVTTRAWIYEGDLLAHRLVRTARSASCGAPTETEVPLLTEEPLVAQARALADALDGATPREIATGADGARALVMAEDASQRIRSSSSRLHLAKFADGTAAEKL